VPARRVVERRVTLGEWVDVPDEPDWHELALDVDYSVIGRVKCALHRPARLLLEVRLRKGRGRPWSIGTQLVRSPFVLDPFISNTRDYVAACAGYDAARVAAFRVITEPGGDSDYRGEVGVQLDARPAPEHGLGPDDRRALAHVLQGVAYPDFEWFPFHIEPPDGVRSIPGERGVLAPAPCTLLFHWPGGRSGLWVVFELVRAGWSGPVHTDGAAFRIEVGDGEGGARRVVAERLLRPGDVAADRGSQRFELDLDLPRDTVVALVTDPGPSGRNQYDLTAWRRVALSPR